MNIAGLMELLARGGGAAGSPFFVGGEEDDDEDYEFDEDDLEDDGYVLPHHSHHHGHHHHGPGCSHHHDEQEEDSESLLEVLPRLLRKGQPELDGDETGEPGNKRAEGDEDEDEEEEEEEEEEGEIMSPEDAHTSVLLDALASIGDEKSPDQISEFVRGGGVSVLLESIKSRGLTTSDKFLEDEEEIPDPENQGLIAFEVLVGLLEISDYWDESELREEEEEAEQVMKNAFVEALVLEGEPVLRPFLETCCSQLKEHLASPLPLFSKILNLLSRTLGSGLRVVDEGGQSKEIQSWPEWVLNFWDNNLDIVAITGALLLDKAQQLQNRAQNPQQQQTKEPKKSQKKGKKGKKAAKKQKEVAEEESPQGEVLIALAEQMSVVETWTELTSSLILGGLGILGQATLLLTQVSYPKIWSEFPLLLLLIRHARRKMINKCKCKACVDIRTSFENLSTSWVSTVAKRFFEPQYEAVVGLLVNAIDLLMNSSLEMALGAEMGMESKGVGECAGLHHALSAIHGLAILNSTKLPPTLGPMLLRRAEQMWGLMLKDPNGVGSGSDVMFVRILGILQTIARSAPSPHKHSIRRHLHAASELAKQTPAHLASQTSAASHSLLEAVTIFLKSCVRRRNSPLRDALRSVVDTLDMLALEKEMHSDETVDLTLDKAIWTSAVARVLVQGLERDIKLASENSHLAADAFRVLSYALSHPDSLVAATVAREVKLGSVGLMEAVKVASQTCHELAYWAQVAWTVLNQIPKEALASVEASVPDEELIIDAKQNEEDELPAMLGDMGGFGIPPGMEGLEQAFLAQMLNQMMMGGNVNFDEMDEDDDMSTKKQGKKKSKNSKHNKH